MPIRQPAGALLLLLLAAHAAAATATSSPWELEIRERFRFPEAMKVVDVKQAFGAVGDGKADDTAALQKAVAERGAFVYLPNGTYLVRDTLLYSSGAGINPTIQGESRDGVVIRLADDAQGFGDASKPKAVLQLVKGTAKDKLSADFFKTRVRNLTIDTGRHAGAVGMIFYANNNGMVRTVRITGAGAVGLDLSRQLNGPLLVSNVEIEGFATGILAGTGPYNSQTLERIVLRRQRAFGIDNDGECLSIRGLDSENTVPAVRTTGVITLGDSRLVGGAKDAAAIVCGGNLVHIRDVETAGYAHAIEQRAWDRKAGLGAVQATVPVGRVTEWTAKPGVAAPGATAASLRLPVEEAPYEPLETDQARWAVIDAFGAVPDDDQDDSEALRKALAHAESTGATTIGFGRGKYLLTGTFAIGGGIRRLQGAGTYLQPASGQELRFTVGAGAAPIVLFDLIDRPLGRHQVLVENAGPRTVVLRNLRCRVVASGPGRTFLEDSGSNIHITHREAKVWARQLNSESGEEVNNRNEGGSLWVLGIKTEKDKTVIATSAGGRTEVLGGWIYVIAKQAPTVPMFSVRDASFSAASIVQYHFAGKIYPVIVDAGGWSLTPENNGGGGIGLVRIR